MGHAGSPSASASSGAGSKVRSCQRRARSGDVSASRFRSFDAVDSHHSKLAARSGGSGSSERECAVHRVAKQQHGRARSDGSRSELVADTVNITCRWHHILEAQVLVNASRPRCLEPRRADSGENHTDGRRQLADSASARDVTPFGAERGAGRVAFSRARSARRQTSTMSSSGSRRRRSSASEVSTCCWARRAQMTT